MAKTAIVNPRGKNGRFKKRKSRSYGRRRRNPSSSSSAPRSYNPRRRRSYGRRRNPGIAPAGSPASSPYSAGGYRRRPNPGGEMFDIDRVMDVTPAATLGVWSSRWACKMAGPMEDGKPGMKHAIAMVIGAHVGSQAVGSFMGGKEFIAYCGALGFAGDIFARRTLFEDSDWVKDNLVLDGIDDLEEATAYEDPDVVNGFEDSSQLGDDEAPQIFQGPDGRLYQLSGPAPDPAYVPGGNVGGFEQRSALGRASSESSFGYA
jgi:hypothetical protein